MSDKFIKTLKINLVEDGKIKSINVIEKDIIDFIYKKDKRKLAVKGELIKLGVKNKKNYIVVLDYDYSSEETVHFVYTSDIIKITNVVHSGKQYSFSPVYSPDESILLLRQKEGVMEYTSDGQTWNSVSAATDTPTSDIIYEAMKNMGYQGTIDDMASSLKELCENSDNIVAFEFIDEE